MTTSYPPLQLQKAVFAKLKANTTLMAKLAAGDKVYDFVPQNQAYPFIHIGEAQFNAWDTKTWNGFEGTFTVDSWYRAGDTGSRGRATLLDIQGDIYDALHRVPMVIAAQNVVIVRLDFQDIIVDPDSVTYHGVQRFHVIMGGI